MDQLIEVIHFIDSHPPLGQAICFSPFGILLVLEFLGHDK